MTMPIIHIGMASVAAVSFMMNCCRTRWNPVHPISAKNSTKTRHRSAPQAAEDPRQTAR